MPAQRAMVMERFHNPPGSAKTGIMFDGIARRLTWRAVSVARPCRQHARSWHSGLGVPIPANGPGGWQSPS